MMRKAQERIHWASGGGTSVATLSHISRKEIFHFALSALYRELYSGWATTTYTRSAIKQQSTDSEGGVVPFSR